MPVDTTTLSRIYADLSAEFNRLAPEVRGKYPEVAARLADGPTFGGDPNADYQLLQGLRARLVQSPEKIIDQSADDPEADLAAIAAVTGDIDYKIMRLHAVLDSKWLQSDAQFRAAMPWLAVGPSEREEFLGRYKLVTGNELVADIDARFPGESNPDLGKMSKADFLKHVLADGKLTAKSEAMLRLGAVDSNFTTLLTKEPKAFCRALIRERPNDFEQLAFIGDQSEDEQITCLRNWMANGHTGFLGEQQAYLQMHFDHALLATNNPKLPKDAKARYLMSLVYDFTKDEPRKVDKLIFRQAMQEFARDPENADAINKLKAAYDSIGEVDWQPSAEAAFDKHPGDPYKQFWQLTRVPKASDLKGLSKAEVKYNRAVLDGAHDPNLARIYDAHALLDRRAEAMLFKRKDDTREQVFRLLSSSTNWDAWGSIARYEGDNAATDPPTPVSALPNNGLDLLKAKMKKAGLSDQDARDVDRMLLYGGAHDPKGEGNPRAMTAYLELSRLKDQEKAVDRAALLGVVSEVEPDSYDYYLIRNDPQLLKYLRDSTRKTVDGEITGDSEPAWRNFADAFNLGDTWKNLRGPDPPPETMLKQPGRYPAGTLDRVSREERARYWAARVAAESYYTDKNGRRALEVVARAQAAGVTGSELAEALEVRDAAVARWIVDTTDGGPGEQDAHETIGYYFDGRKIVAYDLVRAAEKRYRYDQRSIAFAMDFLSPDEVLSQFFTESLNTLDELAANKLDLELKLAEAKLDGDTARIEALSQELRDQIKQIGEAPLNVNPEINAELDKMMRASDKAELLRKLRSKAGKALIDGDGPAARRLHLSAPERQAKGHELRVATDIGTQRQLESTPIGWHRFHRAGVMTTGHVTGALGQVAAIRESLSADVDLSDPAALEAVLKKQVDALHAAMADERRLATSQADWKRVQDEYKKRMVQATTTLISAAVSVTALGIGVGAAPALVQLIWAAGSSIFQALVKQGASAALSRHGETDAREVLAECIGDVVVGVGKMLALEELELGLRLSLDIAAGDSGTVVGEAGAALPSKALAAGIDSIKGSAVKALKDGSLKPLTDTLSALLRDPKAAAKVLGKEFVKAMLTEAANEVFTAVTSGHFRDTKDVRLLYPGEDRSEKLDGFLYTEGFENATQFQGESPEVLGADEWIFDGGPGDLGRDFLTALKTVLVEQGVREPIVNQLIDGAFAATAPGGTQSGSLDAPRPVMDPIAKRDRDVAASMKRALASIGLHVPADKRKPEQVIAYASEAVPAHRRSDTLRILDKMRHNLEGQYAERSAAAQQTSRQRLAAAEARRKQAKVDKANVAKGREATKSHIKSRTFQEKVYFDEKKKIRANKAWVLRTKKVRGDYGYAPRKPYR